MGIIRMHCGAPSYTMTNGLADLQVSLQGGHLTATFDLDGRKVCPYFIAPWWREHINVEIADVTRVLRGDFFCLPFGANPEPVEGVSYPAHGESANRCWDFVGLVDEGAHTDLHLCMDLEARPGTIEKIIRLYRREPVIYQENRISEVAGKTTLGYHPTPQFPPGLGTGIIDFSKTLAGFVSPLPAGDPAQKGYSVWRKLRGFSTTGSRLVWNPIFYKNVVFLPSSRLTLPDPFV